MPKKVESQGKKGRQGNRAQPLARGHQRPEANSQPSGGEQGHAIVKSRASPGGHAPQQNQAKEDGRSPQHPTMLTQQRHRPGCGVIKQRLPPVPNGKVNFAHAVENGYGRNAMIRFIVGKPWRNTV